MTAVRIVRKRSAGWRMPDGAVYVGRPTKWGNPFSVGNASAHPVLGSAVVVRDNHHAMVLFSDWLKCTPEGRELANQARAELPGKDLACWCGVNEPCHADVLLEIANAAAKGE